MGREFLHIFEDWAVQYDETVSGKDLEYREVFRNYEMILEETAKRTFGHVLEFGIGTGNLTERLIAEGREVTAIEPSAPMARIAKEKLKHYDVRILEGDFLDFPSVQKVDSIASTYAFHHLTDEEKADAVKVYGNLLPRGGKIVFADTLFEDQSAFDETIADAEKAGYLSLAEDLRTEYYPLRATMEQIFNDNGFGVTFTRCNHFAWIMEAIKE